MAEAAALEYVDWLVCTMNDAIPDAMWRAPEPHPCAVSVHNIADASDHDYQNIVNSVQRHTRCSAAYCLRKKAGQQEQTCRFDYPRPQQVASSLQFEKLPDGTVHAVLTTRRNDPRVNSHNRMMIQHWRANVDLQMIVDVEACARYMAKYASKGEPRSQPLSSIFKSSVDRLIDDSDARTALRSAMVRSIGEQDFSAQETAHQLLSLPLVSCTFSFVALSLDGGRQLSKNKQSGEQILEPSLLDHYATRSGLRDVNLIQFVSTYSVYRGEVQKRPSPVIVRTFPQYPSNPGDERYGQYCNYQLIKYKPWIGHPSNAWSGTPYTDASCIDAYHSFLRLPVTAECVPHFSQELDRAQQHVADVSSDSEDEEPPHSQEHDEWMLLCQLNPCYSDNSTTHIHDSVDWTEAARTLPPEILRECPSWVSRKRQQTSATPLSPWCRHLPPVTTSTLNTQQRAAYDIVCHHHQQFLADRDTLPLHMIVCGTAGTGKSYLISAISQALGSTCLLTGTTGMAAYNICGKTIHSALQLPVRTSYRDLQGGSLHRLQLTIKDIAYIIIDEMSMIGQRMLAWIDKRLRQATGKLDTPLGGLSLILFGDFAQLPPVGDSPLYSNSPKGTLQVHGHTIYQLFTTIIILEQSVRQAGLDHEAVAFRSLLLRLREGTITESDWQMLLARAPQTATNSSEFTDAIRLYYDKASVAEYNLYKLQSIGTPIARINAIHSDSMASSATPEDAGGLHPVLLLATQSSVMLTANIWQEVGLCNGASGTIQHFLYSANHRPPDLPIAILVDFDNYSGPAFLSDHPQWIPIPPLTFEWESNGRQLSRQQFPLQLRYAITIHKSQGQTLDKAVIDIGKQELAAGCTFVALSRLRSLNHAHLHPMSFRRLQTIAQGKHFAERLQEETRFKLLASQATPDSTHH